jgi:hypothetical protein
MFANVGMNCRVSLSVCFVFSKLGYAYTTLNRISSVRYTKDKRIH